MAIINQHALNLSEKKDQGQRWPETGQFSMRMRCALMNEGFEWAINLNPPLFAPILQSSLADDFGRKRQRDGFGGLALLPQCGREPWPTLSKHRFATVYS